MTRYHCSMCENCFHPSYQTFCMHSENYGEYMSTYEHETDAGYQCPRNKAQKDYISLLEEDARKRREEAREQLKMKMNGIVKSSDIVDEDNNELSLL